ncbi:hypothetical protein EU555_08970 [Methylobacterium nonmethylotrophicum]|uniref:Uncharacterized protein n=2 Tax=Methylobacterium nonmethylotrophicum TaxID=1141884 RepID=A0A4Z0NSS4_9HYPH|nr:hypothetical protein EU555_08970 [Methylobacterium nonmethylotrophicum]
MLRLAIMAVLLLGALPTGAQAQQPPGPAATPADYVLLTILMRHDQSKNLGEINQIQDDQGFWRNFPPEGIEVESWYIAMGLGYVVTLRVPPARLREVNRSVEQAAWKAFRTEFYPTYDAREIVKALRERAKAK